MRTHWFSIATLALFTATATLTAGCGDDSGETTSTGSTGTGGSGGNGTGGNGTGGTGGNGTGGNGTGGNGTGGMASAEPQTIVDFDPAKGEFVEGLEYHDGTAYVGAVLTGQLFAVDVAAKTYKTIGSTPPFAQNTGALVGLTRGPDGAIYAALNSFAPGGPTTGVYRFPPAGGAATLFATHAELGFGNDVRFDGEDMFVTDSFTGTIFKVAKGETTMTKWLTDPLLTPDATVCKVDTMFHLGINGIIRRGDAFFITNTDRASIVKIPVNADGSAGKPEVYLPTDCAALSGVDGIVVDPHTDDLLVAVNYKEQIIRIKADKTITVVAEGAPLQSPASLSIDTKSDTLLVTSAAFAALASDPTKAKPALVSLPLQ